jgi:hypothetical protein
MGVLERVTPLPSARMSERTESEVHLGEAWLENLLRRGASPVSSKPYPDDDGVGQWRGEEIRITDQDRAIRLDARIRS